MKRQSTLSIAISLTLLLSMKTFVPTAHGQQGHRFRGGTGVITVGIGQILRITVNTGSGNDKLRVRFAWMRYMPAGCNNDGVCLHTVQSQGITAPVNVGAGEAASYDVQGNGNGVRVGVLVTAGDFNSDARADALIINSATGEVTSHVVIWFVEGDF